MHTFKSLLPAIADFANLIKSYRLACLGKKDRLAVVLFDYRADLSLLELKHALFSNNWRPGPYHHFIVNDPKRRSISAPIFSDRIVHHAICNVIEPLFDNGFIFDSYACRKNKGTHRAIRRLQTFLCHPAAQYVLKCDISQYFASIDHNILLRLIKKKIADPAVLNIIEQIVTGYPTGIPIGNLTSQLFANIYLNELDYYVKHTLHRKFYLRYMDDFLVLGTNTQDLKQVLEAVRLFLREKLHLELSVRKVSIAPTLTGVDFVGYIVFPTHIRLRSKNVRRFRKRLKKLVNARSKDIISKKFFTASIRSWIGHAQHANSFNLLLKLFASPILQEFSPVRRPSQEYTHTVCYSKISAHTPPATVPAKPANLCLVVSKSFDVQLVLFDDLPSRSV